MMLSVLCFGDSNTFGYIPGGGVYDRYDYPDRWPGVMAGVLGADWLVVEEGLGGRTTVRDDDIEGHYKNGRRYLQPCVFSHAPLDVIIIMLGTNDFKARFNQKASEVAMGVACLVHDIRDYAPGRDESFPEIILVSPPPIGSVHPDWEDVFEGAAEKSLAFPAKLEATADSLGVHYFDASEVCSTDPRDGFHIGRDGHRALGIALAQEVLSIGWPDHS